MALKPGATGAPRELSARWQATLSNIKAISAGEVILLQDVNDPLSLQKQREVRKSLRGEVK